MSKPTKEDIQRVKGMGFLKNTTNDGFSMRTITKNGVLTSEQLRNLADVADKYGNGTVALTTRLTVEVPAIQYDDIETVQAHIAKEGMRSGGTGARVRPVVACKGTVCRFGNCDTQGLAEKIHDRFFTEYYDVKLPHKFKIAVGGCANNCVKPDLNDFGIVGMTAPQFDREICRSCKKCAVESACPMGAAEIVDGKINIDSEKCMACGRCTNENICKCPFGAVTAAEKGFKVYIGGRWGKAVRRGSLVDGVFTEDEVMKLIEKTILLFKEKGNAGERLASMLERVGENAFLEEILKDDILNRKDEILDK